MKNNATVLNAETNLRDLGLSLVIRLASMPLSMLVGVVIARSLGAREFGVYSLAMSVALLISTPISNGVAVYQMREISKAHHDSNWAVIVAILKKGGWLLLAFSAAALTVGVPTLMSQKHENIALWLMTLALIPFLGQNAMRATALRALDRVHKSQALDGLIRPVILLGFIGIVFLFFKAMNSRTAMAVQLLSAACVFLLGSRWLLRELPKGTGSVRIRTSDYLAGVKPFLAIAAIQALNTQLPVQMLNLFADKHDIGIYRAADQLAALVAFGLSVASFVFAPQVAKSFKANDMANLQRLVRRAAWFSVLLATPPFLMFLAIPGLLTNLLYGSGFSGSVSVLQLLSLAYLINVLGGVNVMMMNMTGNEKDSLNALLTGFIVMAATSPFLLARWGLNGQAISVILYYLVFNMILSYKIHHKYKVHISIFGRQ